MPAERPLVVAGSLRLSSFFDTDGNLTDSEMRDQLAAVLHSFATWIRRLA
jgi:hypothetical protein